MFGSRFCQNMLIALLLFVVLSAVIESNLPLTSGFKEYLAFVLTTGYDFSILLSPVRDSLHQLSGGVNELARRTWERLRPAVQLPSSSGALNAH